MKGVFSSRRDEVGRMVYLSGFSQVVKNKFLREHYHLETLVTRT